MGTVADVIVHQVGREPTVCRGGVEDGEIRGEVAVCATLKLLSYRDKCLRIIQSAARHRLSEHHGDIH